MHAQSVRPLLSDGLTVAERRAKAAALKRPYQLAKAAAAKQKWGDAYYTKMFGRLCRAARATRALPSQLNILVQVTVLARGEQMSA